MKITKCAVIGVGYLGKFHADKYATIPNAELVAVCDTNRVNSEEIAAKHKVKAYFDCQQMLDELRGNLDAVGIAAATTHHYAVAKKCLENKLHVLVEKPITATLEEASELIALAKANNVILQVGHLERFNPVFVALEKRVQQPTLIETARLATFKPRGADVNVVFDLMIHDIDLVCHLANSTIKNIHASGTKVLTNNIDVANACLEFTNGCVANMRVSRVYTALQRDIFVYQDSQYLHADLQNKVLAIHAHNKSAVQLELATEKLTIDNQDALLEEIKAFVAAIQNNQQPVVCGVAGQKALKIAAVITQIINDSHAKK